MNEWHDLTEKELEEISKYYGPMSEGEWNLMLVAQKALREKNSNQEPKKPMMADDMMKLILDPERKSLVELIRSVEKHHGIGEEK